MSGLKDVFSLWKWLAMLEAFRQNMQ